MKYRIGQFPPSADHCINSACTRYLFGPSLYIKCSLKVSAQIELCIIIIWADTFGGQLLIITFSVSLIYVSNVIVPIFGACRSFSHTLTGSGWLVVCPFPMDGEGALQSHLTNSQLFLFFLSLTLLASIPKSSTSSPNLNLFAYLLALLTDGSHRQTHIQLANRSISIPSSHLNIFNFCYRRIHKVLHLPHPLSILSDIDNKIYPPSFPPGVPFPCVVPTARLIVRKVK